MKHIYNLKRDEVDKRDYLFSTFIKEKTEIPNNIDITKLPESMDLRSGYSDIKDQGSLGACTAFSACSVLEYLLDKNIDLSELYFYFKEREADGDITIDNGSTIRRSALTAVKIGTSREDLWKYIVSKFADTPTQEAIEDAVNHRVKACYRLKNIDEILYCLGALKKPVLIGVDVYESFENVGIDGYIPMPNTQKEQLLGGHALNICGYFWDKSKISRGSCSWLQKLVNFILGKKAKENKYDGLYFIIRNSWNKTFADKGYMYASADFISKYSSDWWYLDNTTND